MKTWPDRKKSHTKTNYMLEIIGFLIFVSFVGANLQQIHSLQFKVTHKNHILRFGLRKVSVRTSQTTPCGTHHNKIGERKLEMAVFGAMKTIQMHQKPLSHNHVFFEVGGACWLQGKSERQTEQHCWEKNKISLATNPNQTFFMHACRRKKMF